MADFDDDDFDIDELLDEMDAAGTKPKGKPAAASSEAPDSITDKKGGGKAVRFSEGSTVAAAATGSSDGANNDDFISKLPRSQRNAPSASLRTMFFADNNPSSSVSTASKPSIPPSSASRSKPSSVSGSSGTKDDWLGIQDGKASRSPSKSPPPTQRSRSQFPGPANTLQKASADQGKPNENSSDEEAALFKDLAGVLPQTGRRSAVKSATQPQNPQTSMPSQQQRPASGGNPLPQPRSRFGGSHDSTPPMSLGSAGGLLESPKMPSKPSFSGSILDQLGKSPTISPRGSMDVGKPAIPILPSKNTPLPSVAALLGTNPGPTFPMEPSSTFPPKLQNAEQFASFSLAASSVVPEPSPPQTAPITTKKKVIKKDGGGGGGGNAIFSGTTSTLQLPSHLINEEELKAMSASLKTLYTNQLEQLEISYKEQLTFLSESNKRKEELLKDEMKVMQLDYEERLDRLRNEIRQLESKETLKAQLPQEEMATINALSEQLNSSIVTLQDVLTKSKESTNEENKTVIAVQDMLKSIFRENYDKNQNKLEGVEDKVCGVVKAVDESVARRFSLMNDAWRNLIGQVKQNMIDVMEASRSNSNSQGGTTAMELMKMEEKMGVKLDTLIDRLDRAVGGKENGDVKVMTKMEETEKGLLTELYKIQRLQKRTKETTDGLSLEPLAKILESDRDEDQRKREKLNAQVKEMRRDLKRILIENDSRQETNQKYNYVAESELKTISQSIRDLNSQLKFSLISGPSHPDNLTNQFNSSMQQTQAEMEMKMLRDERQALSESMAQINVEKRKLSEEKIHLEKQKLDFEKERDQLRNVEIQLKTKLEETQEIQKKTESVRREEIQLTQAAQVQLKEMDKEKFFLKGKLMEAEQRFLVWEQKLRQEKMELNRERDFMEKLRDQLLCPGCLKPNEAAAGVVVHPPPPPYINLDTTATAMLNNRSPLTNFANDYFNSRSAVDGEELYDAFRRKYFDT